jgi:hypothetical protein
LKLNLPKERRLVLRSLLVISKWRKESMGGGHDGGKKVWEVAMARETTLQAKATGQSPGCVGATGLLFSLASGALASSSMITAVMATAMAAMATAAPAAAVAATKDPGPLSGLLCVVCAAASRVANFI